MVSMKTLAFQAVPDPAPVPSRPISRVRTVLTVLLVATAVGCRSDSLGPNTPARLQNLSAAQLDAVVGSVVTPSPTFIVRDGDGRPVAGVPVTLTVVEGGGTLTNAPTHSLNGPTPIGQLTVGTQTGRNVVRVTVDGIPALDIVVIARPGPSASIRAVAGDGQTALAGTTLPQPVILEVADEHGNGVPAVPVLLSTPNVGAGLSSSAVITGPDGRTPPVTWRLGRLGDPPLLHAATGTLSTTVTAQVQTAFDIEIRFTARTPTDHQATFTSAANRIRAILVGDVEDAVLVALDATRCGAPLPLNETVDDVVIYADITDIDGPGKVLGRAGPCFIRTGLLFPMIGFMQFDAADVANMISNGRFESVVMHEMLHVLGVGGMWRTKGLLANPGTSDPRFLGPRGNAACAILGFGDACLTGAPVENVGGAGTADAHWRESVFDAELMTGFSDPPPMPFSDMTVGSLEDYGYTVNYFAADPFSFAPFGRRAPGPLVPTVWDEVLTPIGVVDRTGRATPLP
jgi:hypothetical protein